MKTIEILMHCWLVLRAINVITLMSSVWGECYKKVSILISQVAAPLYILAFILNTMYSNPQERGGINVLNLLVFCILSIEVFLTFMTIGKYLIKPKGRSLDYINDKMYQAGWIVSGLFIAVSLLILL